MKKVIVTGATGFLGYHLSLKLSAMDFQVVALGRNINKSNLSLNQNIQLEKCDLEDQTNLDILFKDATFVFHCAAKSSPWGEYTDFYNSNVIGTQNVINSCFKNKIQRLIYVSSPSVFFNMKDEFNITESYPLSQKPINNYIKTKIMAEEIIDKAYSQGLNVITIRPRAIVGKGDTAIFPRLINTNNKKFIPRINDKDILVDLTYIDNVIEALILAMKADNKYSGEKYNITNDQNIYLFETIEKIIKECGYKYNSKRIPLALLKIYTYITATFYKLFLPNKEPRITPYSLGTLCFNQTFDITKAKKELGYKPVVTMQETLIRLIKEYKGKNNNVKI